jgi:hypothetical protein
LEEQIAIDEKTLKEKDCKIKPILPPMPNTEFQSARLFFSHIGLLEMDSIAKQVKSGDIFGMKKAFSIRPKFCQNLRFFKRSAFRTIWKNIL